MQLVNCNADDALTSGAVYRLTFGEHWYVTDAAFVERLPNLATRLANDPSAFVYALNVPHAVPGEGAAVMDVQTNARAAGKTVADLVAAVVPSWFDLVNGTTFTLNSVEAIDAARATDDDRQAAKQQAVADNGATGILPTLQHIGYAFILLLVVVGLYLALKAKKELAV